MVLRFGLRVVRFGFRVTRCGFRVCRFRASLGFVRFEFRAFRIYGLGLGL